MNEQLHHLSIDLETYSEVSIGKAGSYRYILDPSFEILLFAYSLDGMPVEVIDVASGQIIPLWLKNALKNPLYIKHAYNAAFEWFALSKYLGWLPPDQWRDTMLHALYCGYPASLDAAGKAMGLPEKADDGQGPYPLFLRPLQALQRQRQPHPQSAQA